MAYSVGKMRLRSCLVWWLSSPAAGFGPFSGVGLRLSFCFAAVARVIVVNDVVGKVNSLAKEHVSSGKGYIVPTGAQAAKNLKLMRSPGVVVAGLLTQRLLFLVPSRSSFL